MGGTLSLQAVCTIAMMCSSVTHVDRMGSSSTYQTIIQNSEFSLLAGSAGPATELIFMDETKTSLGSCLTDATESCTMTHTMTGQYDLNSLVGFSVIDEVKKVFGNTEVTIVSPVPSQPTLTLESYDSVKLSASKFSSELGQNSQLTGCALFYGQSSKSYEANDAPIIFSADLLPMNSRAFTLKQNEQVSVKISSLQLIDGEMRRSVAGESLDFHFICYNNIGASIKSSLYNVRSGKQIMGKSTVPHKFNVKQSVQALSSSSSGAALSSSSRSALSSSSARLSSSSGLSSSSVTIPALSSSSTLLTVSSSSGSDSSAVVADSSIIVADSSSGVDASSGSVDASSSGSDASSGVDASTAGVDSSAVVAASSVSAAVAASSSSASTSSVPVGTVSLVIRVSLPYTVTADNYAATIAHLQLDIAQNLARAFNTTADKLAPYIIIIGLEVAGSGSRRLLQSGDLALSFLILGSISNEVTIAGNTDLSSIGTVVANTLVAQVTSGTFASTNSGATVPTNQTIVVTPVTDSSSSSSGSAASSSGYGSPADNGSSSGLSGGAIAGIVIGVIVGSALIIGAVFFAMYTKKNNAPVADGNEIEARQASPKNGLPIKTFDEPVAINQSAQSSQPTDFHNDMASNDLQV